VAADHAVNVADDFQELRLAQPLVDRRNDQVAPFIPKEAKKTIDDRLHVGRGDDDFVFRHVHSRFGWDCWRNISSAILKSISSSMSIASCLSIAKSIGRSPIRLWRDSSVWRVKR